MGCKAKEEGKGRGTLTHRRRKTVERKGRRILVETISDETGGSKGKQTTSLKSQKEHALSAHKSSRFRRRGFQKWEGEEPRPNIPEVRRGVGGGVILKLNRCQGSVVRRVQGGWRDKKMCRFHRLGKG